MAQQRAVVMREGCHRVCFLPLEAATSTHEIRDKVAVLIGSYLVLVFLLPVALSAMVSFRALPVGRNCPRCGLETLRLQTPWLRIASALQSRLHVHRRWCLDCGWEGAARVSAASGIAPPPPRAAPPRPRPVVGGRRRSTQTLDVRSLDVDGTPWRVMLQCWGNTGVFYGRLVFVAPSGRLWLDGVQSFRGSDQHDVLGQAQSLPSGLLENRLRRLVTEN